MEQSNVVQELQESLRGDPVTGTQALPFAGRDEALLRLVDASRRSWNGERISVVLTGPQGSGRTRLLREFANQPLGDAIILRLDFGQLDDGMSLPELLQSELSTLLARRQLPRIDEGSRSQPAPPTAGRLAHDFDLLARRLPLILLIDDLDAGPRDTATRLGELLRLVSAPFLAVISEEKSPEDSGALVARLAETEVVEINLTGLDPIEIASLIRSRFRIELVDEDLQWIAARSHGYPLLIREVLHAAIGSGALMRDGGTWLRIASLSTCEQLLLRVLPRLVPAIEALEPTARLALHGRALIGSVCAPKVLSALSLGAESLAPAVEAGIITEGTYAFRSPVAHEAALADAFSHGAMGEWRASLRSLIIAEAATIDLELPAATVEALLRAPDGTDDRELRGALHGLAARLAAARRFGPACDCLPPAMGPDGASLDLHELARWAELRARLLFILGRTSEQQAVIATFLERCGNDPPDEILPAFVGAQLARVEYFERRREVDTALDLIAAIERHLRNRKTTDAQELLRRAAIRRAQILAESDRYGDACAIYRDLLDAVDQEESFGIAFDAVTYYCRDARDPDEIADADRRATILLERCQAMGRTREAAQIRASRLGLLMLGSDVDRHEALALDVLEQVRLHSLRRTEANVWAWLGEIAAERGDDEQGVRCFDRAAEIRRRVGSIGLWQHTLLSKLRLLTSAGRNAEALQVIDALESDARSYRRPFARFVLEACRTILDAREGRELELTPAELERMAADELVPRPQALLLAVQGELLLRTESIAAGEARTFASAVIDLAPRGLDDRMLYTMAIAALGRSDSTHANGNGNGGNGANGTPRKRDVGALARESFLESLRLWRERRAPRQISRALSIVGVHAGRILHDEEITPFHAIADSPALLTGWHQCEVRTFGGLRVLDRSGQERGGRHFGAHKSDSKPRKMLAALTVAAVLGRSLKREQLIEMVWGESLNADGGVNNFHVTLSGLRRVIGDAVDFDGSMYSLNTNLVYLDAAVFLDLSRKALRLEREGFGYRAYQHLRQACELACGELLDGIYEEWVDSARDTMRATIRSVRLRLAELAMHRGEWELARATILRLLEADPFDEDAMWLHLLQLDLRGERLRAIREYQKFAERLMEEYGVDASPRLQGLYQSLGAPV